MPGDRTLRSVPVTGGEGLNNNANVTPAESSGEARPAPRDTALKNRRAPNEICSRTPESDKPAQAAESCQQIILLHLLMSSPTSPPSDRTCKHRRVHVSRQAYDEKRKHIVYNKKHI
ncbi:hypothetical protein EVAR_79506_1 [Eumeta japonica]|uniref:Uncharacterized protein n=1 Tax=Eumeta variegata TaxID=151549 RepID=A0A4C1UEQ9_EUMVA|nr:hypothetical protein EVAR_79506_1 [Eumeta japonica]